MSRMHIPGLRVIWGGRIIYPRPSEPSIIYDTPVLWIDADDSTACFVDPSDGEIIDNTCVDSHRFYVEQSSYAIVPDRIDRVEAMHAAYEQVKAELLGTEEASK